MLRLIFVILIIASYQSYAQFKLDEKDIYIGAGTIIIAGGGNIFEFLYEKAPTTEEIKLANRENVYFFDRPATYNNSKLARTMSDIGITTMVFCPLLLLIDSEVEEDYLTLGAMYAEGLGLLEGINSVVKSGSGRYRPFVYNPEAPEESKLDIEAAKSFFSSHTAFAFYSATFLNQVCNQYLDNKDAKIAIMASSYLLAAAVGFFRYEAGMHFPSDILVGAAAGTLMGYFIPYVHRENSKTEKSSYLISPQYRGILFQFSYSF
jgi:membrane-associated phospholipid phosphatase